MCVQNSLALFQTIKIMTADIENTKYKFESSKIHFWLSLRKREMPRNLSNHVCNLLRNVSVPVTLEQYVILP